MSLAELAEAVVCAPPADRHAAYRALVPALRSALLNGATDDARSALRRAILPTLDYTTALQLSRIQRDINRHAAPPRPAVRIALLGSATTTQVAPLLNLFLFAAGVSAEMYEADFGVYQQEILDPGSGLHEFRPQVVLISTSPRDLPPPPEPLAAPEMVAQRILNERDRWLSLWNTLQRSLGGQIVQDNFVLPPWRSYANHEFRQLTSPGRFCTLLNHALTDAAPPYVTLHDVDALAAAHGRWAWSDPRFVHQAKLPCAPEFLVDYAHSLASLVTAQLGLARKCLVLDLDNTLWGGVIGDDGLGGIRLGHGDPEGEAYLAFQEYVKALRLRGVILAVCSKNYEQTAREVFERHPDCALRLPDIACFVANWEDKAANLRQIATRLNIGLDSLVFVDDNPAERAIVRRLVPEVAVPELPEDVTGYIQALDRHRYFQVISINTEDLQRTEYYRADEERRSLETSAADLDSFLQSLDMTARIVPVRADNLERAAQLIQRSNQFNLTTRRRSPAELHTLLHDDQWLSWTISLADRFGDNGLISVALARVDGDRLDIDTWLMSCRVLRRGVEQLLLNTIAAAARARGLRALHGTYLPTPKNALVREHYANLGFTCVGNGERGETFWQLDLTPDWRPFRTFISECPVHEQQPEE